MDAQLTRPHDHHHHVGIHTGMEEGHAHEGEQHPHGVKGVLKKVKRKAKKVKESLTGHGGHHEHDCDRDHLRDVPNDHDLDEEEDDDEDEEMVEDPAVHGVSGHEAAVAAGLGSRHTGRSEAMPLGYSGGGDPMKMSPMEAEENRAGCRVGHHKLTDITEEPRAPFSSPMTHGTADHHPKGSDHQMRARPAFDTPLRTDLTTDQHLKGGDQMRARPAFDTPITTDQHLKGGDQMRATSKFDSPMMTDQHPKGGDHQMRARSTLDTPMTTTNHCTKGGEERARSFVGQQEKDRGHLQVTFDEPLVEDPHGPKGRFGGRRSPPNYQSKTIDRSGRGGEEADVSQLVDSLGKANICTGGERKHSWEEDLSNRNRATASVLPTGSHDQFSPEATRPTPISTFDGPKHGDKLQVHDHHHHHPSTNSPQNQSSYTGKISTAAFALAGTAVSAKDSIASKLGYGGEEKRNEGEKFCIYDHDDEEQHHHPTADQSTYTDKISSATSAIAGTAASAKNVVASKLGYGTGDRNEDQIHIHNPTAGDQYGRRSTIDQPQQNQSSYTDKISSATSAIAGTAASAKNAVASKLGYGIGDRNEDQTHIHNPTAGDQYGRRSTIDHPLQNQSSYTDKIASAKNAVASKLGYGTGERIEDQTQIHNPTAVEHPHDHSTIDHPPPQENQSGYTDKISSAASAIAGTAAAAKNVVASKLGYGGGHEEEEGEQRKKPMGVVTESEEVKRRLGRGGRREEDMEVEDISVSVPETRGVVGRMVKGAVESWFGKGDGNNNGGHDGNGDRSNVDHRRPSSEKTIGSSTGTEEFTESGNTAGGRVLQESGN